jgi:bifunctional UDP-N-acetylglucosamine pyrophosphorylase/glucosamine-1-phosphate N-acetyltransferase
MAVGRARQRNVEGWVARKRPGTASANAAEAASSSGSTSVDPQAPDAHQEQQ